MAVTPSPAELHREVLAAFYKATGGPGWKDSENWLTSAHLSDWHGVATDSRGNVTILRLTANNLEGELPPELGSLTSLKKLVLKGNNLRGEIPSELGQLAHLEELDLSFNGLNGHIPSQLGNLLNLTELNLGDNELSGEIPSELGNLPNLKDLRDHIQ